MDSSELALVVEARDAAASGRGARIRSAAGLSQGELANAIGVSGPTLSRWENGSRRPRGAGAIRYARLLHELSKVVFG